MSTYVYLPTKWCVIPLQPQLRSETRSSISTWASHNRKYKMLFELAISLAIDHIKGLLMCIKDLIKLV